jgi:hypothetical protein
LRLLDVLVAFAQPHHQHQLLLVDAGGHVFDAVIRPIFSAAENDAAGQKRAYRWLAELFSSGNSGNGTNLLLTADRRAFVLDQLPALGHGAGSPLAACPLARGIFFLI